MKSVNWLSILSSMIHFYYSLCEDSFKKFRNEEVYDFIVVGGGAAGSVVAGRLSENEDQKILLLEAGGFPLYVTYNPYFAFGPLRGIQDWDFLTEKQKYFYQYVDQKTHYPMGKGLGGGTLINAMVVTRGCKRDYDLWRELGNEGWGYEDVLPYFRKSETYYGKIFQEEDRNYHGFNGPVAVSPISYETEMKTAFVSAAEDVGYRLTDYNAKNLTGITDPVFILYTGKRWSTYKAYIEPKLKKENFYVITKANVVKILFDKRKRTRGVIFEKNDRKWTAYSSKEVILSAGAIKSPQLMMVSGVGPRDTLSQYKIPVVANIPGVGQHFQDHVQILGNTFTTNPGIGINPMTAVTAETMEEWEIVGKGPLTVPARTQGLVFVNSKYADPSIDYPDIEIIMNQPPDPDLGLKEAVKSAFQPKENLPQYSTVPILLRPKSVGYMTIQSSDPHVDPLIQPNYLSEDHDVEVLVEAQKIIYKLMKQSSFTKLGVKTFESPLPGCEDYERFSDEYFRCQILNYPGVMFHPMGTCKMGPKNDSLAVVDSRLRAYGVKNLRVVDASIIPHIISSHTMAPTIMIGEKAAQIISQDWKFQLES